VTRCGALMLLASVGLVFLLPTAGATAEKKPLEQVLKESVAHLNAAADLLATIKDQKSLKAAWSRLMEFPKRSMELAQERRQARIGMPSQEVARIEDQYAPQLQAAGQRVYNEAKRLDQLQLQLPSGFSGEAGEPGAAPGAAPAVERGTWAFLFPLLLLFIFFGSIALLYTEGMWGNAVRLINVVTAALLATNYWEPVARWLEGMNDSFTYYWDFLALWGLFTVFMVVFRFLTGTLSRVKVKFLKIADLIGSVFFGGWVAWVMVCFTVFTLHTAPLARNFMSGGFDPDSRMFLGLAPDRQWLGFAKKVSRGTFCRYGSEEELPKYGPADPSSPDHKLCVFDRQGRFMATYGARRAALEQYAAQKGATRVESGGAPKR